MRAAFALTLLVLALALTACGEGASGPSAHLEAAGARLERLLAHAIQVPPERTEAVPVLLSGQVTVLVRVGGRLSARAGRRRSGGLRGPA